MKLGKYWRELDWDLTESSRDIPIITLSMLVRIEEELKKLNRLLNCSNFTRIPRILDQITANTKKSPRKKKP